MARVLLAWCLTWAIVISAAAAQLDINRRSARQYEGRGLRATPYGPSKPSSKFPDFQWRGGPPDAEGVWKMDAGFSMNKGDGFVSEFYLEDAANPFMNQHGRWLSWECTGIKGVHIGTILRLDTFSNGKREVREWCEVAKIDLEKGIYYWNSSTTACPDPDTVEFNVPLTRVPSTRLPGVTELLCDGTEGEGYDNKGPAEFPKWKIGKTQGESLPPALKKQPAGSFPPVYPNPKGPDDAVGMWFSDDATEADLIAPGGMIAAVDFTADNRFVGGFGRYNSFICSGANAVNASFSYVQIASSGELNPTLGCTTVKKDKDNETFGWTYPGTTECPFTDSDVVERRVGESKKLPTSDAQTCT